MKIRFNIAVMILATLIMLSLPFIHHHHHNGMLCVAIEHCDIDGSDNDEHTSHHDDHTFCTAETPFFITKSLGQSADQHQSWLSLPYMLATILTEAELTSDIQFYFQQIILHWHNQWIRNAKGLRAPPIMLRNL
jgi:hypothetical protein